MPQLCVPPAVIPIPCDPHPCLIHRVLCHICVPCFLPRPIWALPHLYPLPPALIPILSPVCVPHPPPRPFSLSLCAVPYLCSLIPPLTCVPHPIPHLWCCAPFVPSLPLNPAPICIPSAPNPILYSIHCAVHKLLSPALICAPQPPFHCPPARPFLSPLLCPCPAMGAAHGVRHSLCFPLSQPYGMRLWGFAAPLAPVLLLIPSPVWLLCP